MRPHKARINTGEHRSFTVDGTQICALADEFEIVQDPMASAVTIIRCAIICDEVILEGDDHAPDQSTPIYDQLIQETELTR